MFVRIAMRHWAKILRYILRINTNIPMDNSIYPLVFLFRLARSAMQTKTFAWRPSEDKVKGLIPRPSGAGERESVSSYIGAGLALRFNTLYYADFL